MANLFITLLSLTQYVFQMYSEERIYLKGHQISDIGN